MCPKGVTDIRMPKRDYDDTLLQLPYSDYYLAIRRARDFEWKREWEKQH